MDRKAIVKALVAEGIQVSPEVVDTLQQDDVQLVKEVFDGDVLDQESLDEVRSEAANTDTSEEDDEADQIHTQTGEFRTQVEVVKSFEGNMDAKDVPEFVQYFNDRYDRMRSFLEDRRELSSDLISIGRLDTKKERDDVAVIGFVSNMYETSSGRYMVYLEDPTGTTKVLLDEDQGDWLVEDEIIGVVGVTGDDIIFANTVVRPDVPLSRDVNTTNEEVYAAFISDMHIGSYESLEDDLAELASWISSGEGLAGKVRYLFINGDAVEGVGNYPGQEKHLRVKDVYEQYELFQEFVKSLPSWLQIVIVPGNHDFVRLAEPQPALPEEIVPDLYEMDNVHLLSNPATVRIHGFDNEGITVLLYHGFSFDSHVDAIPDLREKGYEEPHHAMVDYLRRRHLAPTFGSNLVSPEGRDYLVIEEIPDIFVMGHTHAFDVANYKGINLVSSGTMQAQTDFQKRVGHKPDPGMVALVNLKTRDVKVREFVEDDDA